MYLRFLYYDIEKKMVSTATQAISFQVFGGHENYVLGHSPTDPPLPRIKKIFLSSPIRVITEHWSIL